MAELTQEELDRIAQQEADELLANHRTVVTMTPEERERLEREKREMTQRIALDRDPVAGPTARRLSSRDAGGPAAEPPAQAMAKPATELIEMPQATNPVVTGGVDLDRVDPIQLAELAEDAKQKRKTYLSLQAAADNASAEHEAAQARFMAYLQQ